ncbi:unnamed protein product [Cuscuta epithymum]|uniref:Uncharacterized protein n=1 Tax=Cuscuta epithymum TaxID=186058 RepID=A0AAV0C9T8_9ASTE|nr:unnamed protein product [Cuscuta epithymum]
MKHLLSGSNGKRQLRFSSFRQIRTATLPGCFFSHLSTSLQLTRAIGGNPQPDPPLQRVNLQTATKKITSLVENNGSNGDTPPRLWTAKSFNFLPLTSLSNNGAYKVALISDCWPSKKTKTTSRQSFNSTTTASLFTKVSSSPKP